MFQFKLTVFLVFIFIFLAACEPNAGVNQPPSNANAANRSASPTPAPTEIPARAAAMPVTMPLLDAMFSDEAFAPDAKSALQITDEELEKVRDAARNSVIQLGADEGDDTRSTRSAVERTEQEVRKILGPQRTSQFFRFVRERWAGNAGELVLAAPNSVPIDSRIVVNAPAYRMDVFRDGKLTKTYKIGIGYPEFPLPTGLRTASEIIFNPTWTPPDEPWVKGRIQPGKKVEAGSKLNPLGPIKIPIGLPSLIHGGKDPSRLGTFASHGCVGLTSAMTQDFALELASLSGIEMTAEDIKNYEKNDTETKNVKLEKPVPVELRYETIVAEDGKITIYRDVYERGTNTEENLRRVLEAFGVSLDSLPEPDKAKLLEAVTNMAVDARGNAVDPSDDSGTNSSGKNDSAKITRNIKGKKEVVVELAALKGKGYPSPVGLRTK